VWFGIKIQVEIFQQFFIRKRQVQKEKQLLRHLLPHSVHMFFPSTGVPLVKCNKVRLFCVVYLIEMLLLKSKERLWEG